MVRTARMGPYTATLSFIHGTGGLHVPRLPQYKGMEDFQGPVLPHRAVCEAGFDPGHKRIGLIGTGASAVQAVPIMSLLGAKSTVFQRTPCWSPPRLDYKYPEYIKTLFTFLLLTNNSPMVTSFLESFALE